MVMIKVPVNDQSSCILDQHIVVQLLQFIHKVNLESITWLGFKNYLQN